MIGMKSSEQFLNINSIIRPLFRLDKKAFLLELKLRGPNFYQRYIEKKYCSGFCEEEVNKISSQRIRDWYDEFKSNDFVKIPGQTKLMELFQTYLPSKVDSDEHNRARFVFSNIPPEDIIETLPKEILDLLRAIYGRKFWIREHAFFMHHRGNNAKNHIQASWHVDGYNQVTLQLLMDDSLEDSVATEIVPGSSSTKWSFNRTEIKVPASVESKKFLGRAGDLFVFNGGAALHRSYIGAGDRKAVFLNLSSGWYEAGLL